MPDPVTPGRVTPAPVTPDPVTPGRVTPDLVHAENPRRENWWKTSVVYQVYPRSFADTNGDGIGDIPGVTGRLDHLADLGVDVVWLSPVYSSPQDDNGYDISDYEDIDPTFGTLADIDALIAGLHERGMKLVMDLVVNHTSDEHAWFEESRQKGSSKRDWYWWRPARPGFEPGTPGAEPNNWESFFSGSVWTYDEVSEEYYLHLFSPKQPDLNWENPEVRQAVYAMMNRWVERGVDGFRMDVINLISKDPALPDGDPIPGRPYAGGFGSFANGPRLHEFLNEMYREVLVGKFLLTVGEMPGATVDLARLVTDPARRELSMVFTFEHVSLDQTPNGRKWDLQDLALPVLKQNLNAWQTGLAEVGWNSLYWNNHDQPRAVSRFGDDSAEHRVASAKTLGSVLHMLKGTPYVYQGEEIGMTNTYFSEIGQYRDLESVNHFHEAVSLGQVAEDVLHSLSVKSRDNARTPVQWDDSAQAGFTAGIPWLAVNPNYVSINAAAAVADPDSVYHHYKALIALRRAHPVIVDGVFTLLLREHEQLFAYTRTSAAATLVLIANMSSEPVEVPDGALPGLADAQLLLGTHGDAAGSTLAPWESRIHLIDAPVAVGASSATEAGFSLGGASTPGSTTVLGGTTSPGTGPTPDPRPSPSAGF